MTAHRSLRMPHAGLEKDSDLAHRMPQRSIRLAVEQGLSAATFELDHSAEQRGLARTGAAEHSGHLPGTHVEADRVENDPATPAHCQVDGFDHARRLLNM